MECRVVSPAKVLAFITHAAFWIQKAVRENLLQDRKQNVAKREVTTALTASP